MMKKTILAMAALAFMAWGCSSDGDDSLIPQTRIEAGTDIRPSYVAPNYNLYEQTMTVDVQLQDILKPYASVNDLILAKVGEEVRGVATPLQVDEEWFFPIIVAANTAGEQVVLSYYCDKLHRIFTISWTRFDASVAPTGEDGIYKPEFVK